MSCFTSLTCPPSITEGSSTWTGSLHHWALGSASRSSPLSKALHLHPIIRPCGAPFYSSLCGSKVGSANLSLPLTFVPEPLLHRLCDTSLLLPVKSLEPLAAQTSVTSPDPGGLHTCAPAPPPRLRRYCLCLGSCYFFEAFLFPLCRFYADLWKAFITVFPLSSTALIKLMNCYYGYVTDTVFQAPNY